MNSIHSNQCLKIAKNSSQFAAHTMACNSSLLLPSSVLLLVLIGLSSSLSVVNCVQRPDILNRTRSEGLTSAQVEEILVSVENKDQVKLGDYTVKDILAIRYQTVDACRSFNTSYHRGLLEHYSSNNGLFEFYRQYYVNLISWCASEAESYLSGILLKLTHNESKVFCIFTNRLPKRYWYMSEMSVNHAVESYLTAAKGNHSMNSHLEQGLRAELESTCKRILMETDIFQEMRQNESWHRTTLANFHVAQFDKADMACKIYLDKLA